MAGGSNVKEIPLTQGKVALVDDEDFERVSQYKWNFDNKRNRARRTVREIGKKARIELLPSLICSVKEHTTGIRYLDVNPLNYQKNNIIVINSGEISQGMNKKKGNKHTSCFVGVSRCKGKGKWLAQITCNKIDYYIGSFSKELEAAAAYNKKAVELYGENAKLNPLPLEEN
jgi:AP2-like factor, euAP2 lineage